MSRPNASFAVPPGDRDDVLPPIPCAAMETSAPVAGREPDEAPLVPAIDLQLPRIEQALSDGAMAFADMMRARQAKDWPAFEAAAERLAKALKVDLKSLSHHVAQAVKDGRARARHVNHKE